MSESCLLQQLTTAASDVLDRERREAPRVGLPAETSLDLRFADGRIMCVKALNVSSAGLEFECGENLHIGERIQLRLGNASSDASFEKFEIVRVEPGRDGVDTIGARSLT